jgi:CubicO group peptidase (beta-lactamase class C family)
MAAYVLREGNPESVGMDPARVQKVRELLADWVRRGDTPSVVALVARRGVIVLHDAFGVCHCEDKAPTLKLDSIFPLASGSKPLAAAAVMCLVDDGRIGLNRPFIDYVPELDVPEVEGLADAKVADLLCHTAGFNDLDLGAYIAEVAKRAPDLPPPGPGQHPKINARIRLAAGAKLTYPPRTAHAYGGFGYMLLGDIIRRISGQPFWQFVRSRLFEPLGMIDSHYMLPPELRERRVYRTPGFPATEPTPFHRGIDSPERDEIDVAGTAASSTAKDLAVFLQMLLNRGSYGGRRVLSRASVAAMTRNQLDKSMPAILPWIDRTTGQRIDVPLKGGGYGYGFFVFTEGDRFPFNGSLMSATSFGHGGNGGTCVWADPERELVGIFLCVSPRFHRGGYTTNSDLFQNAVHAAIVD